MREVRLRLGGAASVSGGGPLQEVYLSLDEVANILGVSEEEVQRLIFRSDTSNWRLRGTQKDGVWYVGWLDLGNYLVGLEKRRLWEDFDHRLLAGDDGDGKEGA